MTYRTDQRNPESNRAMPTARATHAPHRARILGLGLSVGIAIALSGCQRDPDQKFRDDFTVCINDAVGSFTTTSEGVLRECRDYARTLNPTAPASGMSASGQDAERLEAKPASPASEAGDAR